MVAGNMASILQMDVMASALKMENCNKLMVTLLIPVLILQSTCYDIL